MLDRRRVGPDVLVAGRYRLSSPVADGATASVWRAVDEDSGREVAVKLLRDGAEPDLVERGRREARILEELDHPNLVRVLDSGEEDGVPFTVMELLEGEPLSQILAARGTMPADEATGLVADVADGLGVAHHLGVVHRDVKPGNIVCHDDVPTLVDFGIARTVDATTMTNGLVVGTASYLAPEQAQGQSLDATADVYSLGCVLYELLTGHPPFSGDSPVAIAVQHVQAEPVPPADIVEVPPAVNAIVMRCLAKDARRRPADGAALAAELRAARADEPDDDTVQIAAVVGDGTAVMPAVTADAVRAVDATHTVDTAAAVDAELIDPSPLPPRPAPARNARTRAPALLVLAFAALLVAVIGAIAARDDSVGRPVPDVTSSPVADATRYLEGAGLDVDITNVPSEAPAGIVIASDPAAGELVESGGTVGLSVSSGPQQAAPVPVADDEGEKDDDDRGNRGRGRDKDDDDD